MGGFSTLVPDPAVADISQMVDAMFQYEFGCTSLMQLGDVNVSLPCKDGLLDQPSIENIKSAMRKHGA
jgi:hypothetical protein